MKNGKVFFTVIIALLLFTLSSCSSLMDSIANTPEDTPAPSESGGENEPSEPDAEAAPAGFTLFPEGEYLEKRFRTSDPLPGFDYVPTFHGSSASGTPTSCSTETTYYYMAKSADGWGKMLYYMDKATGLSGPLCGKPECDHTDSACNGYLGDTHCYTLSLYDGRIWWIKMGLTTTVHSCALDGSDHRLELQPDQNLVGTSGPPNIYFHRGTMFWVNHVEEIRGGVRIVHDVIIGFPLDGSDPYIIYDDRRPDSGTYPEVHPLGDKLLILFNRNVVNYNEDYSVADWQGAIDIYLFDLNTRQLKTVYSGETDFLYGDTAVIREDGIYVVAGSIIEDGRWISASRFLPWGGESFEPIESQSWYEWNYDGRFIHPSLGTDELTIKEYTMDGQFILNRSFPVSYTGNPLLLLMRGWDEDYYYIQLPSVRVAVATDGSALYYLAGTEEEL